MGIYTGHFDVLFKLTTQQVQHLKGWQAAYNGYCYHKEGQIKSEGKVSL